MWPSNPGYADVHVLSSVRAPCELATRGTAPVEQQRELETQEASLFGTIGYVTVPRFDKRAYLSAEVSGNALGVRVVHLPATAIRDHFYCATAA
jgi:hypothetical protein